MLDKTFSLSSSFFLSKNDKKCEKKEMKTKRVRTRSTVEAPMGGSDEKKRKLTRWKRLSESRGKTSEARKASVTKPGLWIMKIN
jgi:hypothetical protein